MSTPRLLRFANLKTANIVTNWPQLRRLIDGHGFPPGYMLAPNTRVWDAEAIEAWLDTRRAASASVLSARPASEAGQA